MEYNRLFGNVPDMYVTDDTLQMVFICFEGLQGGTHHH